MKIFDVVYFNEVDDYEVMHRRIGIINGFKQKTVVDKVLPDWNSDRFFTVPNRLETIFSVMTANGQTYEKHEWELKPIELKLLEDYTVDELIKEIASRKNVNTMNSGNVTTIIKR